MKESAGVLQQAKFIALVLKLILVSVIYETRNIFVFNSIGGVTPDYKNVMETEDYQSKDNWFSLTALLFWVVGVIEFLIIFNGATIFNNQANLLQIFVHIFGIAMLLNFKQNAASDYTDFFWCLVIAG